MKQKTIALLLAMTFTTGMTLSALAEEPEVFSFRGGVTWGMSMDEILEIEGVSEAEADVYTYERNGYTVQGLEIEDVSAAGYDANANYLIFDNTLLICGYEFDETTDTTNLLASLTAKYGDAQVLDQTRVDNLLTPLMGYGLDDTFDDALVTGGWEAPGDTYIMLYVEEDDIELVYLGEAAIADFLSREEIETEAEPIINTDGL